jgi:rhamnogalacturonyl hydrolase YesR
MKPNDRNWERGTWYTGVMAAHKSSGDEKFLKQALEWGQQHQWQVGTEKQGANRLWCVETWAELYLLKKDRAMIEPAIKWLSTAASNSPAGAKVWYLEDGRRYADSLYGACTLAMLTKATGDKKYLDYMHAFFWDVHEELFDKDAGLFYRDKRFISQQTKNGKKVFWSRGNGWVLGGIVRILEYLPEDDPQRPRYVELLKTMATAIAKRQGVDGLWRPNLDDPDDVALPEDLFAGRQESVGRAGEERQCGGPGSVGPAHRRPARRGAGRIHARIRHRHLPLGRQRDVETHKRKAMKNSWRHRNEKDNRVINFDSACEYRIG